MAALLLCFGLSTTVEAQKVAKKKKIKYSRSITVNPVALFFNNIQFTYEQRIPKKLNSWTAGAIWNEYNAYYGYEAHGSYRWYLNKQIGQKYLPLEGFSAGPAVSMGYFMVQDDTGTVTSGEGFGATIGGEVAYKMIFEKGLTMEFYGCARFMVVTPDSDFYPLKKYNNLSVGVNIGYSMPAAKKKK